LERLPEAETKVKPPDPLAVARDYLKRGWHPIPYDYGTKSPRNDGWQRQKITDANVHERFNSGKQNIGVQLGPKSNGLADVDLDCSEAMILARHFLPTTDAVFGRKSKPAAHYLYRVLDPDPVAAIGYRDEKKEMICELRLGGGGKGAQTMFPGSMHPDNELVEWESDGEPTEVTCATLNQACIKIAIGTLLLRHWPMKTGRHEGALRLGGFLARAGWQSDDIGNFVSTIADAAGDEEWKDRERAACDSYEAHERGEPVAGFPKLIEYFSEDVVKQIAHILNYRETDTGELLERMNEKYCVVPISGKVRVVTWKE
jgi:Bifunctional DNA primase/polymerase, N-terminal